MAITDLQISDTLQTDAPSIKYTGNEGPQASPQHQQEQMIAQKIWEGLSPEQRGQFQSFEQFFQSGIWKQILQQMQADEAQEQTQGIASLGPRNMEQQMPMPRMGAEYGGRIGFRYGKTYGSQRGANDTPEVDGITAQIQWLMKEMGLSYEEALERTLSEFRKPITPLKLSEDMIADMKSRAHPSQIKENPFDIKVPNIDPGFERPWRGENIDPGFEVGIETIRGRR